MITQNEYSARRKRLAEQMGENTVAILPAAKEAVRNGDAHYRFRQSSNFYYLTGFNEPEALLVVFGGKAGKSILFNRTRDPAQEIWTGKRLGQEKAPSVLGVDEAYPIGEMQKELPRLLSGTQTLYYTFGHDAEQDKQIIELLQFLKSQVRRGIKAPDSVIDLEPLIGELRLFKSDAEIQLMRQAIAISVAAHQQAMRFCKHAKMEYELEAELIHIFARQGCRSVAYDPIVGSGENTCILHYTENNQALQSGELVLIDAGGEYQNYAADLTRTFPVNGHFSPEQRAIYQLVLNAQQAGIACIKPGIPWPLIQQTMVTILTQGLLDLGILQGKLEDLIQKEAYKPFYMHNSGHWLGLDVHDSGRYKQNGEWRLLEPGMVLTVEPGIYISANIPGVDKKWWNIGVRIEDDILVTSDGHDNLSQALAVNIDDIEALMRG